MNSRLKIKFPIIFVFLVICWFWVDFLYKLFYVSGAYLLDAGLLGYNFSNGWFGAPQPDVLLHGGGPQSMVTSQLQIHLYVIQSILGGWVHFVLPNEIQVFSVTIFLNLCGLFLVYNLGLSIFRNLSSTVSSTGSKPFNSWIIAFGAGLLIFNRSTLGSLGYPHYEFVGSAFAGLGVVYYFVKKKNIGISLILCGLLGREDMGFHLAALAIAASLLDRRRRTEWTHIGLFGFIFSFTEFVFMKLMFHSPSFMKVQFGDRWQAQITFSNFLIGIKSFLCNNAGITSFIVLISIYFILTKNYLILVPLVAATPWIIFNSLSADSARITENTYFQFPFILYLSFYGTIKFANTDKDRLLRHFIFLTLVLSSTIGLTASFPQGDRGTLNWRPPAFPLNLEVISQTNTTLSREISQNGNSLVVDDAVVSLYPNAFENIGLYRGGVLKDSSHILYFPHYAFNEDLVSKINLKKYQISCVKGTHLALATPTNSKSNPISVLENQNVLRPFC